MIPMKNKELNELTAAVKEVTKTHIDASNETNQSIRSTVGSAGSVNKLSKSGNKSILIKAGLALIVFPEPIVSDMLGTSLIAAGAIHEGIKRQSIYLDDLPKALKSAMKEIKSSKQLI